MGNSTCNISSAAETRLTESGLTPEEEEKIEKKFGDCSLDNFINIWDSTGAPRYWGVALHQVLCELGGNEGTDYALAFCIGVRKVVGNVGDVIALIEAMFPPELVVDGISARVCFTYWISGGRDDFPRHVCFENVRDIISTRVRYGLRKLFFDEACLNYTACCEGSVLENVWALSLQFESTEWDLLYSTSRDGRSYAKLVGNIQMYDAPSIMVIKTSIGPVLGAVCFGAWNDMGGHYNAVDAFLFIDRPNFRLCRSTSKSPNLVYFNQRNKYAPTGIGFGGQVSCPRLWVDSNFDGHYLQNDAAFESAVLEEGDDFQVSFSVHELEVWGLGGPEAYEKQQDQLGFTKELRMQRRKVDRARFAESGFDRDIFLGKTFGMASEARAEVEEHRKEES